MKDFCFRNENWLLSSVCSLWQLLSLLASPTIKCRAPPQIRLLSSIQWNIFMDTSPFFIRLSAIEIEGTFRCPTSASFILSSSDDRASASTTVFSLTLQAIDMLYLTQLDYFVLNFLNAATKKALYTVHRCVCGCPLLLLRGFSSVSKQGLARKLREQIAYAPDTATH